MNISKKNYDAAGFLKKHKKWIVIAIILILCWFAFKMFFGEKKPDVPTLKAQKGKFEIKINQVGSIEAEVNFPVYPKTRGKILDIVKEGTKVKNGDFLFSLDPVEYEEKKKQQELELSQAETNLKEAKANEYIAKLTSESTIKKTEAELSLAQLNLVDAKKNFEKYERLMKEKLVQQKDYDSAKLSYEQKKVDLKKTKYDLELARIKGKIDEGNKRAMVNNTETYVKIKTDMLDRTIKQIKDTVVLAQSDGVVFIGEIWSGSGWEKTKKGSDVGGWQAVIRLPDLNTLIVKIRIPESEVDKIRIKQKVKFNLESEPDKVYFGEIKEIGKFAQASSDRFDPNVLQKKFFEVKISIDKKDMIKFKPGMTVNAEIFIDEIPDAVFIPQECLFNKDGKRIVYIKQGWGFKEKEVEAGKSNDNFVQITKGLSGGETLASRKPDTGKQAKNKK